MCDFCKREQVTDDISEMVNIIGGGRNWNRRKLKCDGFIGILD